MVDGDTLDIGAVRIRLHGVDSPESRQSCVAGGRRWACGERATRALVGRIGGRTVACEERDRDSDVPGFLWVMLLPLLAALCWSMVLIVTRLMRLSEAPLTVLFYSSVVGWLVNGPLAWMSWRTPSDTDWLLLIGIGLGYALGQYLTIRAFMFAPPSLLAPFAYSSMIRAMLIGATVFGTFPDLATVAGTTVLIGAGLYVWHREIVRGRERVRGPPEQSPGAPR